MEQSSKQNSTVWKAAKANHTQKSSSLPVVLAGPLPASLHWPAPSIPALALLVLKAASWKRSVNPIALVKLHPGLLWTWFATAMMGAKFLLGFE